MAVRYTLLRQRTKGVQHFKLLPPDNGRMLTATIKGVRYLPSVTLTDDEGKAVAAIRRKGLLGGGSLILSDPSGSDMASLDLPRIYSALRRAPFTMRIGGADYALSPATAVDGERKGIFATLMDSDLVLLRDGKPIGASTGMSEGSSGTLKRIGARARSLVNDLGGTEREVAYFDLAEDSPPLDAAVIFLILLFRRYDYEAMRSVD